MNDTATDSVNRSWDRIDAWLTTHAPASLALLRPGADPSALADAEATMGLELPADLRASLLRHDGHARDEQVLPRLQLCSVKALVEQWELKGEWRAFRVREAAAGRGSLDDEGEPLSGGEVEYHRAWVPVADFQGDLHVIDTRPGPTHGRLGFAHHEGGGEFWSEECWPSFAAYLAAVADHLTREGDGVHSPFGEPEFEDGRVYWDV